ncbi:MAG: hypothetical protein R3C20_10225 [Planctomycetaceae bacterium]
MGQNQLAPGSRVVTEYYEKSGLDKALDALGFQTEVMGAQHASATAARCPNPWLLVMTGDLTFLPSCPEIATSKVESTRW